MAAKRYPIAQSIEAAVKSSRLRGQEMAERERDASEKCGQEVRFSSDFFGPIFDTAEDATRHWESLLEGTGYWCIQAVSTDLRKKKGPKRRKPSPPPNELLPVQWQMRMDFWRPVRWSPKIGQGAKLVSFSEKDETNDSQTHEVFG